MSRVDDLLAKYETQPPVSNVDRLLAKYETPEPDDSPGLIDRGKDLAVRGFQAVLNPQEEPAKTGDRVADTVASFYPQTIAQAELRQKATGLGKVAPAVRGAGWGAMETAGGLWTATTKGLQGAADLAEGVARGDLSKVRAFEDIKPGYGEVGKTLLDKAAMAGAAAGGADTQGIDQAVADARKENPEAYSAMGKLGFAADILDPTSSKLKFLAKTPKWKLNEAVVRNAERLGYKLKDGILTGVRETIDGPVEYAIKPSEFVDVLAADAAEAGKRSGVKKALFGKGDSEKNIKALKDAAKQIEKADADPFSKEFMGGFRFKDLSKKRLAELADEGYLANRYPLGGSSGTLTARVADALSPSAAIKRGKELTLGLQGQKAAFARKLQQGVREIERDFQDVLRPLSRQEGGTKKFYEGMEKRAEAPDYKVLQHSDTPLTPEQALSRKDELVGKIEHEPTPENLAGERYKALVERLNAEESAAGVGSTLRYRLDPEVFARIKQAGEAAGHKGDDLEAFIDKSKGEIYRLIDKYESPELFEAARGIEQHPIFARKAAYEPKTSVKEIIEEIPGEPVPDYYGILGLEKGSLDADSLKRAYRRGALKYHPDVNPSPDAHQEFLRFAEAYDTLNNPAARQAYEDAFARGSRPTIKRRYETEWTRPTVDPFKVWDESAPRGYVARIVTPETRKNIDKLLRTKAFKEGDPAVNFMRQLAYGRGGEGGTMASVGGPQAIQRSERGGVSTTTQMRDWADEFLQLTGKEADEFRAEAAGLINHPNKKVAKIAEDLQGQLFEPNVFRALEKRINRGAHAIASQKMAEILAFDPILSAPRPPEGGAPFRWRGSLVPQMSASGKPYMELSEIVPGAKVPTDRVINPEAGEYLKGMHRNLTLANSAHAPIRWAENYFAGTVRKMMLALPVTAARNAADSIYKNFVTYGREAVPASGMASAVLNRLRPELVGTTLDDAVGKMGWLKTKAHRATEEAHKGYDAIADAFGDVAERVQDHTFVNEVGEKLTVETLAKEALENGVIGGGGNRYGFNKPGILSGATLRASGVAEDHARLAAYIVERQRGHAPIDASLRSYGVHWKSNLHDDVPARLIKGLGGGSAGQLAADVYRGYSRYGAAFWFFQRNNYPFWIKALATNPGRASAPIKALRWNQEERGGVPAEFQSKRMSVSPFVTGLEIDRKDGKRRKNVKTLDLSTLSQFALLGDQEFESSLLPVLSLFNPVTGKGHAAEAIRSAGDPDGIKVHNAYLNQELRGPEAAFQIASDLVPAIRWFRRPLEASDLGDRLLKKIGLKDIYPEEGIGTAIIQTGTMPFRTRKESVDWLQKQGEKPYHDAISVLNKEMESALTGAERRQKRREIAEMEALLRQRKREFRRAISDIQTKGNQNADATAP